MDKHRQIVLYKNYFKDFYTELDENIREKIDYVLFLITVTARVPKKFLDHISGTDGLFEIRVEYQGNIYRIFSCFDEGRVVILFNCFQKKSQKTPSNELNKAMKIMNEYFKEKPTKNKN